MCFIMRTSVKVQNGLLFWMHIPNSYVEGTLSQISDLGPRFCFISKDGKYVLFFHSSLHNNVFNTYVKFQV